MIKKLLLFSFLIIPFMSIAQSNNRQPVLLQMRDGKVYFDNVYSLDAKLKKAELFKQALSWFKSTYPSIDSSNYTGNERKGEITGTGIFKVTTSASGNYYWLRVAISIVVHNATYELKVYDIYEKPIEKGISNEYSKIEYRWWDYRQGKPWSAEDETLFKGLSSNIDTITASLLTQMNK